ncbi:MAG: hypothetical protein U9N45_03795, partial [Gemmatimonadota bacterium]|nr:hypothetical protein [Gemmatimonadota bacterium]
CCMDSLTLSLDSAASEPGVIRIVETEHVAEPCRCICDYTVYGRITGFAPGSYRVEVVSAHEPEDVLCSEVITVF